MNSCTRKKYKKPKQRTLATTNPDAANLRSSSEDKNEVKSHSPLYPLAAKDSEWVDILQTPLQEQHRPRLPEEEELLQLVDCEDGPELKPLAIMFPGLLEKDPQTLQSMLNKGMSTTEVTKHLVKLGQKANFQFMKKADRLLPHNKIHLASVLEDNKSVCSVDSTAHNATNTTSDYEADTELMLETPLCPRDRRRGKLRSKQMAARSSSVAAPSGNLQSICKAQNYEKVKKTVLENALPVLSESTNGLSSGSVSPIDNFVTKVSDYGYDADVDTVCGSAESISSRMPGFEDTIKKL